MGTKFLADSEILTVAMNIEEDGYKFYDEAAKAIKSKEAGEIFCKLRDDELDHGKIFREMFDLLPGADSNDLFGIKDEIASYLRALVETGVFKSMDKGSFKRLNEVRALETGIQAERDSVLFYTEARRVSVNPKAKDIISRVIDIEKEHIVILTKRLRIARKLF
jgi:rubrerythrin